MKVVENKIEEIHRRMELAIHYRDSDYETKWKNIKVLIDELGDALYPFKTQCPVCGSTETMTSLEKYNQDSGEKVYLKRCITCTNSWLTTELGEIIKHTINIKKIVVLITNGTDSVSIHTDLPSPYPAEVSTQDLMIDFQTRKGAGVDYVRENFGIEPEVINTSTGLAKR